MIDNTITQYAPWTNINSFSIDSKYIAKNKWYGDRGIFAGGNPSGSGNIIDYVTISNLGNATDFGDLTSSQSELCSCSDSTRMLISVNNIEYITVSTISNSFIFGNLNIQRAGDLSSCSDGIRGVFLGGSILQAPQYTNAIDYVIISNISNAFDFADLSTTSRTNFGSCSNDVRGVFGGGYVTGVGTVSSIEYITIQTFSNSISFGNLTNIRAYPASYSNDYRGIFAGGCPTGSTKSNIIDYVIISTTMNAIDFGDLIATKQGCGASCNSTRGICGGGYSSAVTGTIDYVTIDTTSNATSFGNLTVARGYLTSSSGN